MAPTTPTRRRRPYAPPNLLFTLLLATEAQAQSPKDQQRGDHSDPGWHQHQPGTVAYEFTGALPGPARVEADASPGPGSMPPMSKPAQDIEVKVRKPARGHLGH